MQTLKCSVDVNVLEAQNVFFSRTKDQMTKKTFVLNEQQIRKFIDADRIKKKKKETDVVLAFPCELDANVFKWVLK